jgi:hypothetical protein
MANCIDCGKDLGGKKGTTICIDCADKRVQQMSPEERIAMAKVGFDALIDEVTGYQKIRPKGDLKKRHKDYELEERLKP